MAREILKQKKDKQLRSECADKCRKLKKVLTSLYVAIYFMVELDVFLRWLNSSKSFSGLLRFLAKEHFGEAEDVTALWELRICQMITDIAEKEMTKNEIKYRDISKPALIIEWFAEYLERIFPKNQLSWESKIFSKDAIDPVLNELEKLTNSKRSEHVLGVQ